MNKAQRCLLHSRCICRKWIARRDWQWHWQHLLRELGAGIYADPQPAPAPATRD